MRVKGLRLRDASAADREAVFEFCRTTWPGYGDYIPRVWRRWLRDRRGRFLVADLKGTPVGIAKITDFGGGEIWLEGLRVDPRHRGKGIGSVIHMEVLRTLRKMRPSRVRFCTGTTNRVARRISEKYGFEVVARFRYYWCRSRRGRPIGEIAAHRDIGMIYEYIARSRFLKLSPGLIAEGWIFREMNRELLEEYVRQHRVVFLASRGKLRGVAIYPYEENDDAITLGFVDGDRDATKKLARNCLYIARAQGMSECSVAVPTRGFARLMEEAGFARKDSLGQVVLEYGGNPFRVPRAGSS